MKELDNIKEEHLAYLDQLEKEEKTHMPYAQKPLQKAFPELTEEEASLTLENWFKTLGQRHFNHTHVVDVDIEEIKIKAHNVRFLFEHRLEGNNNNEELEQVLQKYIEFLDKQIKRIRSIPNNELEEFNDWLDSIFDDILSLIKTTKL